MDLNSKSFNWSIFNLGARYFVLLERMFGAHMVHDTSVHQIFRALFAVQQQTSISRRKKNDCFYAKFSVVCSEFAPSFQN